MLMQYEKEWSSNPFTFRIPWNTKYPEIIDNHFHNKIELIKTGIRFKETFHRLTQDLDDDEWIYWCIDDKYVISIEEHKANRVLNFVKSVKDPDIISVCFHFVREIKKTANHIQKKGSGVQIHFEGLKFIEHRSYINNWLHQFFRVKALREFWSHIKEPEQYQALCMDNDVRPLTGISLTLDHNICTYGESTDRGYVTENCQLCCNENNILLPECFTTKIQPTVII